MGRLRNHLFPWLTISHNSSGSSPLAPVPCTSQRRYHSCEGIRGNRWLRSIVEGGGGVRPRSLAGCRAKREAGLQKPADVSTEGLLQPLDQRLRRRVSGTGRRDKADSGCDTDRDMLRYFCTLRKSRIKINCILENMMRMLALSAHSLCSSAFAANCNSMGRGLRSRTDHCIGKTKPSRSKPFGSCRQCLLMK